MEEKVSYVLDVLEKIRADVMLPRSARNLVNLAIQELKKEGDIKMKAASAVSHLDKAGNDPNLPPHIRTGIWSVLSVLESLTRE